MSKDIILKNCEIYQYFKKIGIVMIFRLTVIMHIVNFIKASTQKGYAGTVTDVVNMSLANCHRTTFGKVLSEGKWDVEKGWKALRSKVIKDVSINDESSKEPLIVILDDTISEKTKPLSQAKRSIAGTSYHQSHSKGKNKVWGHQLLTMMLSKGLKISPIYIERYIKGEKSKIDRACEMIESLPVSEGKSYVLCDSWYTNKRVVNSSFVRGYHYIGALKTNRIISPKGIKIQLKEFTKYIEEKDVYPVTVNGVRYLVYRYEGNLNGIDNAVVLLTWNEKSFKKPGALHAFLCTDTELKNEEILKIYSKRWPIEIFFRHSKTNLGLNKYQVRSTVSIDRILFMIALTYVYCCNISADRNFSNGLQVVRKNTEKDRVQYIYEMATQGVAVDEIYKKLKIAS
jgi:hypothetical protein